MPTLDQHLVNVSCLLGSKSDALTSKAIIVAMCNYTSAEIMWGLDIESRELWGLDSLAYNLHKTYYRAGLRGSIVVFSQGFYTWSLLYASTTAGLLFWLGRLRLFTARDLQEKYAKAYRIYVCIVGHLVCDCFDPYTVITSIVVFDLCYLPTKSLIFGMK